MLPAICDQQPYAALFPRIDALIAKANAHQTPALAAEIINRKNWIPNFSLSDTEILRTCIELIAYSQQAQARLVQELINNGVFNRIFQSYNVKAVANLQPDQLYNEHWNQIGAIRFQSKVAAMVGCAQALLRVQEQHSSFMSYLGTTSIPTAIHSQPDINAFWNGFAAIQDDLDQAGMPFFNNLTSLCHLLMALGYDCAKPDSVVMSTAAKLNIVSPPRNALRPTYSDRKKQDVITTMQVFCLCRNMRVPVLDVYLLICGGQTGALHFVNPQFYPCP